MPLNKKQYRKPLIRKYKKSTKKVLKPVKAAPTTMSSVKNLVSKMIIGKKEMKHNDYNVGKVELYHNVATSYMLQLTPNASVVFPQQGDTDNSRNGNQIYLSYQTIRILFGCKLDRLNTKYRVSVIRVRKGGTVASYEDVFDNITGNVLIDPFDTDKVKVLYSKIVQPSGISPIQFDANKEKTAYLKLNIQYKKNVSFLDDTSVHHNLPYDNWLVIQAYDTYGSLITDNIAWCQTFVRTNFKEV